MMYGWIREWAGVVVYYADTCPARYLAAPKSALRFVALLAVEEERLRMRFLALALDEVVHLKFHVARWVFAGQMEQRCMMHCGGYTLQHLRHFV